MKQIISTIALLLGLLSATGATNRIGVTLAWDPSPGTDIAGYNLYYGVASGTYTNTIWVGNVTNASINNLAPSVTYYFAATAKNTAGLESEFSNEVAYTTPNIQYPNPPTGFRLLSVKVEVSTNLVNWITLTNVGIIYVETTNGVSYYRTTLLLP